MSNFAKKVIIALAFVSLSAGAAKMYAQTWNIGSPNAADLTATISGTSPNYTLTIDGTGDMQDFATSSDVPWHSIRSNIQTLVINEGITSIGDCAFVFFDNLTGILTIPNGVTTIGSYAFGNCPYLTGALTIPDGVTSIGDYAFINCNGFTGNLTIPDGVITIGNSAFMYCSGFTGVLTIPNSVTTIEDYAFASCSGFTGVLTIPDGITSIGDYAFIGCSGLTSINCKTSAPPVPVLGAYAFTGVSNSIPVYVVCGMLPYFESSDWATYFTNFQEVPPVVTVLSNNNLYGSASITQINTCENSEAIIAATANSGYCFSQWNDGITDNPRTVEVTTDITYTADFTALPVVTVQSNNNLYGSAIITQMNTCENSEAIIAATANSGYCFSQWSDGSTDNPRTVEVTTDTTFMAIFEHLDGTDNILANQLNIYPNPVKDVLTVESAQLQNAEYIMINMAGQVVMRGKLQGKTTIINVSSLANGVYFIKTENMTVKFVKN